MTNNPQAPRLAGHPPSVSWLALLLFSCLLLTLITTSRHASAQSFMEQEFALDEDQPWLLEADGIESLQGEQVFEAQGDVVITQGVNTIQADTIRYSRETGMANLRGNVRIEWNGDILEGQAADFDLGQNIGQIKEGEIFLSQEHFYIRGETLEKQCGETYAFENAHITTCDGPTPAWSIKSKEGDVTEGGYAKMWHPRFQILDVPVLYSPYMIFPVKNERQSGFLIPEPSYSTRLGFGLSLPYYWAIDEEQDATLYANMLSKRGLMLGVEYRHYKNLDSKGVWQADWLYDSETAPLESEEDRQFRGDGLNRPNANRYWVRGKYDGYLADPLWQTKFDVDIVSDQNYLREFKHGYTGFNSVENQMIRDFGRGMDNIDSLYRKNAFELSRNWTRVGFRGGLYYTQALQYWTDNQSNSDNPTLQRLPELNLDFYKNQIGSTPFELEADNQMVYFWREYGTTGARLDMFPKISLPWNTAVGTLTPSVGWRETLYAIDSHENSPEEVDTSEDFFDRGIPVFSVDAFSSVYNVFDLGSAQEVSPNEANVGNSAWTKIKHTVQPELNYTYVPHVDQKENPSFTRDDRIGKYNRLSYSLHNIFNRRVDQVVQRPVLEDGEVVSEGLIQVNKAYLDFLRIRFDQSYDIEEADRNEDLDQYERRPFSDIRADVTFYAGKYISLVNRTWYSPYSNAVTEHEHMLRGSYSGVGTAYFGFDFRDKVEDDVWRKNQRKREIVRVGGLLHLPRGWSLRADYKRDLLEKEDLEKIFGIGYAHQCYYLDFLYSQTLDEDRFEFRVSLKGLEDLIGFNL